MEDYYRLIGVSADAEREEVREAYRTRKAELDAAGTDESRAEASRLNRAWNVLSDELQRTKYDDQLAEAKADGTVDEGDDAPAAAAPSLLRGRAGRGGRERPARQPRQAVVQETEINGVALASNKDRGIAMAIDLLIVFLLLMLTINTVFPAIAKATQKEEWDAYQAQTDVAKAARDTLDDADSALDKAEDSNDAAAIAEAKEGKDDAQAAFDDASDTLATRFNKVLPSQRFALGGWTVLALALTIMPSILTGRTIGKRLRRIRLVREDGSPVDLRAAFLHYGLPIGTCGLVATVLGPLLMQIVGLVWLFGVTSFARNPRRQGWHDRLAKTIVAAD